MTVRYEWDVETTSLPDSAKGGIAPGDVLNHRHADSYLQATMFAGYPTEQDTEYRIVLVRDNSKGRSWAYLQHGALPQMFVDTYDNHTAVVPKHFHNEVARATLPEQPKEPKP